MPGQSVNEVRLYEHLSRADIDVLVVETLEQACGYACLADVDPWNGHASCEIHFAPGAPVSLGGKEEAWLLFLDLVFRWYPLTVVATRSPYGDDDSIHLIKRVGFEECGVSLEQIWSGTEYENLRQFRLNREAWHEVRQRVVTRLGVEAALHIASNDKPVASHPSGTGSGLSPVTRPFEPSDLLDAFAWYGEAEFPHYWNATRHWLPFARFPDLMRDMLRRSDLRILLSQGGRAAGYVQLTAARATEGTVFLAVYLAFGFRSDDNWTTAFSMAIELAKSRDLRKVYLELLGSEMCPLAAALKAGFADEGETPSFFWFDGLYRSRYRLAYYVPGDTEDD